MAGLRLAILPSGTGAGIEQNRDDDEIDLRSRPLRGIRARGDEGGAIDATDRKMPPAAVIGHAQVGIPPSGDCRDAVGGFIKPVEVESEMPGGVAHGRPIDEGAAFAHGGGAEQRRRWRLIRREHDL